MSTQQDIYAPGYENHPPMLNKDNYVPWSSRLLYYAKSKPSGKLIYNSIMNGLYVRRMIPEPGDSDREVLVAETFHELTDDELTEKEVKQMEADDQAIQIILMGLPKEICVAVNSCETAQEIWLCVQKMMKGSDIRIQDKNAKFFNEWERFTSTDRESIESYYHRFLKLMNDFKRNKHFPEKIASNLKFLNNLQPEWRQHVKVNKLRAERLAKTHDPIALMAQSQNPYNYPVFHPDQPSPSLYMQQPLPNNNNFNPKPSFNTNYMQQPMPNPEDITDPTTSMKMMQMVEGDGGNQFRQYAGQNVGNLNGYNNGLIVVPGIANSNANQNGNGNVVAARAEGNAFGNNGTQTDKAPVYDSDGSAKVHKYENCYNNDIFNMFTQEEQYNKLLDPIPEPHLEQQNDSNVISTVSSVEQGGGTVEQHPVTIEEIRAYFESLYNNLAIEVEKVNSVYRKMKETNADLTTELAIYKNQ
ncbi:hypothetical protein Tco_0031734 [Tanacetum coccineum]